MLTRAIVRPPGLRFAQGLTAAELGVPDRALALEQHARYCGALELCELQVLRLPADDDFPDACFVEDTAIVTDDFAVLTRPGAPSRQGEVARIEPALAGCFAEVYAIQAPGTLDGGDVCRLDDHFFIGISGRTNEAGARQLAGFLARHDYASTLVDVREVSSILHLKSGITALGDGRLVAIDALRHHPALAGRDLVPVPPGEDYAANVLQLNDHLVIAAGFPRLAERLDALGYALITLDMSEFRKMDGALTCLSLRF